MNIIKRTTFFLAVILGMATVAQAQNISYTLLRSNPNEAVVRVDFGSYQTETVSVNGTEMPYDKFVSISPNIIKSITVLKNKEALTKYGEKGKDGVILVEIEDHPNQKGHEPFLLKGLVIDEKKEPVVGAIVRVKGTKQGTVTDVDGRYTIEVADGATIEVAYVGMETATFTTSKAIAESRTTAIVLKKDGSDEPVKYEATLTYNGTDNDKSYDVVDQMPEFPGGVGARMQYLAKNVKYPVEAQRKGQQGNVVVKFTVEKTLAAETEINALEQFQKDLLNKEYETIEKQGIEFVRVKHLQKEIFEIKSNELRSLFKYKAGAIIVIGVVFVKKTQKTPKDKIKLAIKRLNEV